MSFLNHPHTVWNTAAHAEAIACANNDAAEADNDGWAYVVQIDPLGSGRAIIEVYDEDGYLVGKL